MALGDTSFESATKNDDGTFTINYVQEVKDTSGATVVIQVPSLRKTVSIPKLQKMLETYQRHAKPHNDNAAKIEFEIAACQAALAQ